MSIFRLPFTVILIALSMAFASGLKPSQQVRAPNPKSTKLATVKTSDLSVAIASFAFTDGPGSVMVDSYKVCAKQIRCAGELPLGQHAITLSRDGYLDSVFNIMVPNGSNYYTTALVEKPGLLTIHALDSATGKDVEATVFMDDRMVGKTPWTGPLGAATKSVYVRASRYMESKVNERPAPNKEMSMTAKLVATDIAGMAKISSGCFQMGQESGKQSEKPVHEVCLSSFVLDKYEVTQGAYQKQFGSDPSHFVTCGINCPVESIQWKQAKNFCEKLGKRLPTEAEWEYAARAGSTSKWGCGIMSICVGTVGWTGNNSDKKTHPVGQKPANSWGIYDMTGNVAEWTADWFGSDYYSFSQKLNPKGANRGDGRVARGGSWDEKGDALQPSARAGYEPDFRESNVGFRCAMDELL